MNLSMLFLVPETEKLSPLLLIRTVPFKLRSIERRNIVSLRYISSSIGVNL